MSGNSTVLASDGAALPLSNLPQVFANNGTNITTITVVYAGKTYVQTLTYAAGFITNISAWTLT